MMTESNGTEAGEAVLSPPIIRSLEQQLSLVFWDVQSESQSACSCSSEEDSH